MTKQERIDIANEIFRICARYGRRFFSQDADHATPMMNPRISRFELAENGQLWYIDKYRGSRLYASRNGNRGGIYSHKFSDGGTLRALVENLRDFILDGTPIRNHFGPWHRDLWGYGPDMQQVQAEVRTLLQEKGIWEKK